MALEKEKELLRVEYVSKRIKQKQILDHVNLQVFPGEAVGLVGPNGSGKSSLMKCISTAYKKDEGSIYISGYEVERIIPKPCRAWECASKIRPCTRE